MSTNSDKNIWRIYLQNCCHIFQATMCWHWNGKIVIRLNIHHCLHQKLSKWQLPMQPMTKFHQNNFSISKEGIISHSVPVPALSHSYSLDMGSTIIGLMPGWPWGTISFGTGLLRFQHCRIRVYLFRFGCIFRVTLYIEGLTQNCSNSNA